MTNGTTSGGHAGDISPREAWERLGEDSAAILVDVRTRPEWLFVGVPETKERGVAPIFLEWQLYPAMGIDGTFAEKLEEEMKRRGAPADAPLLFLCRSGARSAAAAALMTARGHPAAFNIEGGFEGGHDARGHRGNTMGWKAMGLPWRQS